MRLRTGIVVILSSIAALASPAVAGAQCVSPPKTAKIAAALNAKDAYDAGRAEATKWQAGGSKQDPKTVQVTAMLDQRQDVGAIWTVTYSSAQGRPVLSVRIDSKSEAVVR